MSETIWDVTDHLLCDLCYCFNKVPNLKMRVSFLSKITLKSRLKTHENFLFLQINRLYRSHRNIERNLHTICHRPLSSKKREYVNPCFPVDRKVTQSWLTTAQSNNTCLRVGLKLLKFE